MGKFDAYMKRGEKSLMEILVAKDNDSDLYFVEGERISGIRHEAPSLSSINEFRLNINHRYEILDRRLSAAIDHHEAHAYCMLGYRNIIGDYILVYDGYGVNDSTYDSITLYRNAGNNKLEKLLSIPASHSVGMLYSAACGMLHPSPNPDRIAGKLMGLSAYADPDFSLVNSLDYQDQFTASPIQIADHSLANDENNYYFSAIKRMPHSTFREMTTLAATTQAIFEEAMFIFVKHCLVKYDIKTLILTGGSALNCKFTQKLVNSKLIQTVLAYPLADDSGASLGGFFHTYGVQQISKYNKYIHQLPYDILTQVDSAYVLDALHKHGYIGWYEGGSEYGPRALCHRSILALPTENNMAYTVNLIKEREYWRPFAPVVISEEFKRFYGHEPYGPQDYMLMTDVMTDEFRDQYKSVSSIDGSSRPQCLYSDDSKTLHGIMKSHGLPVLLNTSMNSSGRAVPEAPAQAISFAKTTGVKLFFCNHLGEIYTL